jgi:hypothetical protein
VATAAGGLDASCRGGGPALVSRSAGSAAAARALPAVRNTRLREIPTEDKRSFISDFPSRSFSTPSSLAKNKIIGHEIRFSTHFTTGRKIHRHVFDDSAFQVEPFIICHSERSEESLLDLMIRKKERFLAPLRMTK